MRQGEEVALKEAIEKDFLPSGVASLEGSDFHYNLFESMISGRDYHDETLKPNEAYRKIFKAQLIKDYSMAYTINKLMSQDSDNQKYLVVAGKGHC